MDGVAFIVIVGATGPADESITQLGYRSLIKAVVREVREAELVQLTHKNSPWFSSGGRVIRTSYPAARNAACTAGVTAPEHPPRC